MRYRVTAGLFALALLAACGRVTDLTPREGRALPPPGYGATASPSAADLLTVPTQARPQRSDEILTRSEPRADDPFDIPPGAADPAPERD